MSQVKRLLAVPIALFCALLVACEPQPHIPDGTDVGVTLSLPSTVTPDETVPFVAHVTNHGTTTVSDLTFLLAATNGATVTVTDTMSLASCSGTGTSVVGCPMGPQSVQPGFVWAIQGTIQFPDTGPVQVLAGASSDGAEPRPDPHPNGDSVEVDVTPSTPVNLRPAAWSWWPSGAQEVGNEVQSYTTVYVPQSAISGLTVSQTFPAGMEIGESHLGWTEEYPDFSNATFSGTCSTAGNTVTCTADRTVEWASSLMMRVSVTPSSSGTFDITHTASSAHPEPSPDPDPNTVQHQIVVNASGE